MNRYRDLPSTSVLGEMTMSDTNLYPEIGLWNNHRHYQGMHRRGKSPGSCYKSQKCMTKSLWLSAITAVQMWRAHKCEYVLTTVRQYQHIGAYIRQLISTYIISIACKVATLIQSLSCVIFHRLICDLLWHQNECAIHGDTVIHRYRYVLSGAFCSRGGLRNLLIDGTILVHILLCFT